MPDSVSVTFELSGEDGGVWTLSLEGDDVRVIRASANDSSARTRAERDGRAIACARAGRAPTDNATSERALLSHKQQQVR